MATGKIFDHRLVSLILTQDQLAAVGSLVLESTFCESTVEDLIWKLCKLDPEQGKHLTNNMPMQAKLDLLGTLGKPLLRSKKKVAAFTLLVSQMKEANTERNIHVHGNWQPHGAGVLQVIRDGPEKHSPAIVQKRRPNKEPQVRTAADILKAATEIARFTWALLDFSTSWRRVPSLEKSLSTPSARKQIPAQTQPKSPKSPRPPRPSRA